MRMQAYFLAVSLFVGFAVPTMAGNPPSSSGPSILFCTPKGVALRPYLDLDWMGEIHGLGFEPDYTELSTELTWERISQYNVLVLYGVPEQDIGERNFLFPGEGPRLDEYVRLVERYLDAGGGVFMMVHTDNADRGLRTLIEPWGARLPLEFYIETDEDRIAQMPRMRGHEPIMRVDTILPSPVTEGVRNLWLPYGEHYNASWTGPISVSDDWQVVVKGTSTSHTMPIDLKKTGIDPQPDPLVRPGGVKEPDLMAIREYKRGRIFLAAHEVPFSIGSGTQWLFNRRCLSRGLKGIESDFERMILNTIRWLAEPSMKSGVVGGYQAMASRLTPPNLRAGAKKEFEDTFWSTKEKDLHRSRPGDPVFRGLIGAQSEWSGAKGSVADYAAAAGKAGLDFLIFCETFTELTPASLRELGDECKRNSSEGLLLLPGYKIDTNIGNHMFFAGHDLPWPRESILIGPDKSTLAVQRKRGEPAEFLHWVLYDHQRYEGHMVGYFNFEDPRAMRVTDLKLNSAAAIQFYRDGKQVEDLTEDFLVAVEGTLTSMPVAFNLVQSPEELVQEVRSGNALTYAQAASVDELVKSCLRWNSQYDGMNVFPSDGPMIRAWPETDRTAATYGAESFVVDAELMESELHVTSDIGLSEIRVMNGRRQIRRFLPGGAKSFHEVLYLPGLVQQNIVVIARDINGGKAVSFPRRCWKPGSLCVAFCGDHVNDCGHGLLARGIGMFRSHMFPEFPGGETWDGGPKGLRPVVHLGATEPLLTSNLGAEGAGMNAIPIMESTDDQAIVVRSVKREVYGPETTPINSWHTYGPLDPSRLLESMRRYTEYNRPLHGVQPTGWAAYSVRGGATMANFSCHVTFKADQVVETLQLQSSDWKTSRPVALVVGHGTTYEEFDLSKVKETIRKRIDTGGWFGIYSTETYNNALFINRSSLVHLEVKTHKESWQVGLFADIDGTKVKAGESYHHEMFSINEAINTEARGPERFLRVLAYLRRPENMEVIRGRVLNSPGYFDVEAERNEPIELKVRRPSEAIAVTIPVRVDALNPRWSAGLFQIAGHTTGKYTDGKEVYTSLGFDMEGYVHAALYPDYVPETHVVVGHPIVCDRDELVLEVMPKSSKTGPKYAWHIAVNNPTDQAITANFRRGMDLPGLEFAPQEHTIPAGGYLNLTQPSRWASVD